MPNEKEGSLLYWLFKKRFEYSAFTTMSFIGLVVQTDGHALFFSPFIFAETFSSLMI